MSSIARKMSSFDIIFSLYRQAINAFIYLRGWKLCWEVCQLNLDNVDVFESSVRCTENQSINCFDEPPDSIRLFKFKCDRSHVSIFH